MLNSLEGLLSAELIELSVIVLVTTRLDFFVHLCPMCAILYIADVIKFPFKHLRGHFVETWTPIAHA